jgi:hypothetical protein
MSTFNPTTGCVGTRCPPFNSDQEYDNYMTALRTAGVIQTVQESKIKTNTSGTQMQIVSNFFPAVQVVSFGDFEHFSPSVTLAIVYVTPAGNSMFAYRNDPANQITLVPGGCQIAPQLKNLVQTASSSTKVPVPVWTIFLVCVILGIIGAIVYFSRRKPAE